MKKNWTLRAGALLMALTLMTSCFVGGTFAKYTTAAEVIDSARVAKFGVEIEVSGDSLFSNTYTTDDTEQATITNSVIADTKVVAPGTKSGENSLRFKIKGEPEVAVKIDVDIADDTMKEIFLAEGTYVDWTKAPYDEEFNIPAGGYYPVKFTLKQIFTDDKKPVTYANEVTLADLKAFLDTYSATAALTPPGTLDSEFELSWEWDFDDNGAGTNDKADTLLGNIAADSAKYATDLTEGTDYSTEVAYDLTITVTQID